MRLSGALGFQYPIHNIIEPSMNSFSLFMFPITRLEEHAYAM